MAILISQEALRELAGDNNQVCLPDDAILTPGAKDFATKTGITVKRGSIMVSSPQASYTNPRKAKEEKAAKQEEKEVCVTPAAADCPTENMIIEAVKKVMSGLNTAECVNRQVTHISGDKVVIGPFAQAPAGQNIRMTDVITSREANLAAGFMIYEKSKLPWHLTYDEIDYVVEGEFELQVGDKVYRGKPGDVISIPKGTSVVFGSPSRTKVFYVTYPANWEEMSN